MMLSGLLAEADDAAAGADLAGCTLIVDHRRGAGNFDFLNGFHDAANSICHDRLHPRAHAAAAVIWAAFSTSSPPSSLEQVLPTPSPMIW